jgi:hypothetical protein
MHFLKNYPNYHGTFLVFALFMILLAPKISNAQCNCGAAFDINGNLPPETEVSLTEWIAANPTFPQNTLSGPCLRVTGTLIIDKNYTFSGVNIKMMPESRIIVKSGFSLTINQDAHLQACPTQPFLWQGIFVDEGASLFLNRAHISDAKQAVTAYDNSTLQLHRSFFNKNWVGLFFPGDGPDSDKSGKINLVNPTNVSRCSFTCFGTLNQD